MGRLQRRLLSRSKLKQAFLIDSEAELNFMYFNNSIYTHRHTAFDVKNYDSGLLYSKLTLERVSRFLKKSFADN